MRSTYSVLLLSYKSVSVAGGVRKAVGGYLRYMQFRNQRSQPEREGSLGEFVRYLAHRDRTSPGGRVFGANGSLTSADRLRLVDYVARSTKGLAPRWVKARDGKLEDRQRAVYQFVISPDDWRGLDLRRITRAAMKQLEADAGVGGLGPWFAAEHRNTAHHHTQIVLAARRESSPGRFNTLIINRARLQRMKDAISGEIERQRSVENSRGQVGSAELPQPIQPTHGLRWQALPQKRRSSGHGLLRRIQLHRSRRAQRRPVNEAVLRIRGIALRYRFQMERELEAEQPRSHRAVWER
jgi:hypothetical protein